MRWQVLALVGVLAVSSGCYKTTYYNFVPDNGTKPEHGRFQDLSAEPPRYWRSFWIYGWVPAEMNIFADRECGGAEHIVQIETQRTFVQGLIAAFAGYYINIYSPYSGRVLCDHSPTEESYSSDRAGTPSKRPRSPGRGRT